MSQAPMSDITQDDKLWAMLSYLIPVIAIVELFMEDKKARPYVKFSAVQSLVASLAISVISAVTLGCGSVLAFALLWWAYQAYQGLDIRIPVITDFIHNQGWA